MDTLPFCPMFREYSLSFFMMISLVSVANAIVLLDLLTASIENVLAFSVEIFKNLCAGTTVLIYNVCLSFLPRLFTWQECKIAQVNSAANNFII
ncbi:hypothetical protein D3C73_803120 [compost metagenome]